MTESFINILLGLSVQAVIMGIVIIVLQTLLRKQIPPKINFLLWLLVFAKLIIPINYQSVFSVFQIFKQNNVINRIIANRASDAFSQINYQPQTIEAPYISAAPEAAGVSLNIYNLLFIAWIAVSVILIFAVFQYYYNIKINLFRNLKSEFDTDIIGLSDNCFDAVGIPRETEIICSSYANTPFVFGLLKPLIVIPYNLFGVISKDELRIIIMHEAMHIKKRHYRTKFIIMFINIIHWYNPIAWYFSGLINKEMEFDCDYELLNNKWDIPEIKYAEALLNVAKFQKNKFTLSLTFGETNFIKRVAAIMLNKKFSTVLSIVSLTLVFVLSIGFFTLAKENKELNEKVQQETAVETPYISASDSNANNTNQSYVTETPEPQKGNTIGVDLSLPGIDIGLNMDLDSLQSNAGEYVDNLSNIFGSVDNIITTEVFNSANFWVDYYNTNMTKEILLGKLIYKTELTGNISNIENLKIDIDDCYVFFEYTDEKYIRMDFYSLGQEYIKSYKYEISESGDTSTIKVKRTTKGDNSQKDPKAVVIYIPQSINDFENVSTEISMCHAIIQGIKTIQFTADLSMSSANMRNNSINDTKINSSMSAVHMSDNKTNDINIDSSMDSLYLNLNDTENIDVNLSMSSAKISYDKVDKLNILSDKSSLNLECGNITSRADISSSGGSTFIEFANEPDDLLVKGTSKKSSVPSLPVGWAYDTKNGFEHTYGKGTKVMSIISDMGSLKIK